MGERKRRCMNPIISGIIRFNGYRISEFSYKCDPSFEFEGKDGETLRFNFQKAVTKMGSRSIQLNLRTNVFYSANDDIQSSPYTITLELAGRFDSEEDWMEQWETNALAILFPYARMIISTLTSQSGREPIILPTVNLAAMFNANSEEQDTDSSQDE